MILQFNLFVMDTFARLQGVETFLQALREGMPTLKESALRNLEQRATEGQWDYGDFATEESIIAGHFETWVPAFAAYSIIILLYSIIETQLSAFADHVGCSRGSNLRVKDMSRKGIDQSAKYMKLILSIDLKDDPDWGMLKDLQRFRNFIAHRNGKRDPGSNGDFDEFVGRYKGAEFRKVDGFGYCDQIWISLDICSRFVNSAQRLFNRVFKIANLAPHSFVPTSR